MEGHWPVLFEDVQEEGISNSAARQSVKIKIAGNRFFKEGYKVARAETEESGGGENPYPYFSDRGWHWDQGYKAGLIANECEDPPKRAEEKTEPEKTAPS